MTAAQQAMYASRPAWAVGATALAVCGGALGCIGLILRKRWSRALLQGIVLVVALGLVIMSNTAAKRGWIA